LTAYVVDASVAAKWFFPEVHSEAALRLRHHPGGLYAPDYLLVEFASLVGKKVRRGEIERSAGETCVKLMKSAPVQFEPWRGSFERALVWSLEHEQPIYDCLYLALAESLEGRFVTADERFLRGLPQVMRRHALWVEDVPAG